MGAEKRVDGSWWDAAFERQGHTGWADQQVYAYDQPLRRASVRGALEGSFSRSLDGREAADIGCGTGDFTLLLKKMGANVLAIDFSPAVLEQAERRARAAGVAARFVCASATQIPADDAAFDVVTSITVMQHLVVDADLATAIGELARVLRADGRVVFLELAPPLAAPNRAADGHVIERPPQSWRAGFEAGGFVIEREFPYPQYGITALRMFARAIDRLRGTASTEDFGAMPPAAASPAPGFARRLLRLGLALIRTLILLVMWPLDHLLRLQVPKRQRYYRLWILKKSQGGR